MKPMQSMISFLFLAFGLANFTACSKSSKRGKRFTEPVALGGRIVASHQLNRGEDLYLKYCVSCHGELGDGKGPRPSLKSSLLAIFEQQPLSSPRQPLGADCQTTKVYTRRSQVYLSATL